MIAYFDTETTGFQDADIVELGSVVITDSGERFYFNERCRPEVPITEGARKVHGISEEDVANCRPSKVVADEWLADLQALSESTGERVVLCAHNLQFDVRMLSRHLNLNKFHKFCSLQLSKERLPEFINHKLGTLYEGLGFTEVVQAHSALDDCKMLEQVVNYLLQGESYYDIARPKLLTEITFGKHKGKKFTEVPEDYLVWVHRDHSDTNAVYTAGVLLGYTQE